MIHGRADRAEKDKDQKDGKGGGHSNQGDENNRQKRAAQDKETCSIVIGQIANGWLNHKGKKPTHPGDQPNLCEVEREFIDEFR
jgi:hypothetical protein